MNDLTDLKDDIVAYLFIVPSATAYEISEDFEWDLDDVQDSLIELDDEGKVLMRNGWYRLSEASRKRKHLQDSSNSIK